MRHHLIKIVVLCAVSACHADSEVETGQYAVAASACDSWQIFGNPQHSGVPCAGIDTLGVVDKIEMDASASKENADLGFLAVHYASAITRGTLVITTAKHGYTSLTKKGTQTWGVEARKWIDGLLQKQWDFDSKWKPIDATDPFGSTAGYESLFQPVMTQYGLYVPSSSGTLTVHDPETGRLLRLVNPFAATTFDGDSNLILNSALSADADGNVYYTAIAWATNGSSISPGPRQSFLVRVAPDGSTTLATWSSIATSAIGVPQAGDRCSYPFTFASPQPPRPWPTTPDAIPPQFGCGPQRPPINAAPAITPEGQVIVISAAHNATSYAFLIAVDGVTLAPQWAASLRDHILDGCGVRIPFGTSSFSCRIGSHVGVDPNFNLPVAGRETGLMEVAPMVAPDGTIYVGSYSGSYDTNRGHLMRFDRDGKFLGVFDFGWETTPAVSVHDGTFSLIQDNNHNSPSTGDGTGPGGDFATVRLSPDLQVESETRPAQKTVAVARDFLDGQPALDTSGNAYMLNATGDVYKIDDTGAIVGSLDLGISMETLSAEMAWGMDDLGRSVLYVPYAGTMWVIGATSAPSGTSKRLAIQTGTARRGSELVRQ